MADADVARRESPAVAVTALPWRAEGVVLEERAFLGHLNLRGDSAETAFMDAVTSVIGALPVEANTTSGGNDTRVLWLGPDEWLLVLASETAALEVKARLDAALAGTVYALTDVSSAQTVLRLRGERALELLRSGTTLDVHPGVFGPGQCAQTNFAKAVVTLCPLGEGMDVIVRRSFADYLARWIMDWTG